LDLIVKNISELITGSGFLTKDGRKPQEEDLGIIQNAALVIESGKFVFVGPQTKLQSFLKQSKKKKKHKVLDTQRGSVLPGFIEAHTHLVFAGDRKDEFEMRNRGATYQEISAKGGGIKKTVSETKKISIKDLTHLSQSRADVFIKQGVTTLESKSGYGLDVENETKLLKVNRNLKGCRVVSTFLGMHSIPTDSGIGRDQYVQSMIALLPELKTKKLIDRVDVFIEKGFFDRNEATKLFEAATRLELSITAHTEQMSHTGGVMDLIKFNAASGDHLIEISESEILRIAKSNTVAMLLPTSDFYLKIKYPPARKLIDQGAAVALATDFNPGTSPTQDLSLVGVLARLEMKMTLPEVFCAYTYNAAKALGLHKSLGSITLGQAADFIVTEAVWSDFFYQVGSHPVRSVVSPHTISGIKSKNI
jgi:imidazolonepropionase